MKLIWLILIFTSPFSYSQSIHDKKIKQEMLSRTDELILKIQESEEALEREEVSLVCKKINYIFKILPDQLISIGSRMNMFHPQVIKMENQTRSFLIYIHQQSNICKKGVQGDHLDITEVLKKFKSASKMFDKHRSDIKKLDTDYENVYNYYYEFH
jgi:hypothetical protein